MYVKTEYSDELAHYLGIHDIDLTQELPIKSALAKYKIELTITNMSIPELLVLFNFIKENKCTIM